MLAGAQEAPALLAAHLMNTADILAAAVTILPLHDTGVLVHYGNKNGADVDLLAVIPDEPPEPIVWKHGVVDLLTVGLSQCCRLLALMDPGMLEPVRNGTLVSGSADTWQQLQRVLDEPAPQSDVLAHLMLSSMTDSKSAFVWYAHFEQTADQIYADRCLQALSFACSEFLSAQRINSVKEWPTRVNFEEYAGNEYFSTIRSTLRSVRAGGRITSADVKPILNYWHEFVLTQNASTQRGVGSE